MSESDLLLWQLTQRRFIGINCIFLIIDSSGVGIKEDWNNIKKWANK